MRQGRERRRPRGWSAPRWRVLSVLVAIVAAPFAGLIPPASAATILSVTPIVPASVTVGATSLPASLVIQNNSTAPDSAGAVTLGTIPGGGPAGITLVPSCGSSSPSATGDCSLPDPGVFQLSATGLGSTGTACAGTTFTIAVIDPTGRVFFDPSTAVVLEAGEICTIDFTFDVLGLPTIDSSGSPGVQTSQIAYVSGTNDLNLAVAQSTGTSSVTVAASGSTATITTSATPTAALGNPISDTATVTGGTGGPTPTGVVTFTAFGPGDTTCTGPPAFGSGTRPLGGGAAPTADSGPFTPTLGGTYRWIAAYSGDSSYAPSTTACNDPNESSLVTAATITTFASGPVVLGGQVSDTATVTGTTGGPSPTGTVTFRLFGPGDVTCSGPPVFNSGPWPLTPSPGGPPPVSTAASGLFTPGAPGTYLWTAAFGGDAAYPAVATACGDANETSIVTPAGATISTSATSGTIGSAIGDTATVSGSAGPVPTGTVTFTLYGPGNPTCAGAPPFTSGPHPLTGGPPPTATSGPFTPTVVGSYQWVASYSGDANYAPVTSPCNAPGETSVVSAGVATLSGTALSPVSIGNPIRDTATVTGAGASAPAPTGTVTFTLFGPGDPTCAGAPVFTSSPRPLGGGPPPTATSEDFTPTSPGTYNWVAAYSGDQNYAPVTSPCGAPGQASIVNAGPLTIATSAQSPVPIGNPIRDTATVTGTPTPTGTVTFTLFGPADPTCTGAPIFTSAARPLGGGPPPVATSADFTPTAPGTYNWVAVYSGDANHPAATSPCGAPNEASVVTQSPVTIDTSALSPVAIGNPIRDTVTVTGTPTPTGTVTFTLFGPGDLTCTGAPIFTSAARPLGGGPPPSATSADFTPPVPGLYNWVAVYGGDANHPPATSPCGAPNGTSVVNQSAVAIATSALSPVPIGSPVRDTATVTGTPAPTGTVTFSLFGPADATCAGAPIFISVGRPLGGGPPPTATSADFTPTSPGTYNWVAAYSGDVNHPPATSPCGAPNEASVVTQVNGDMFTEATPTAALGSPISDTATVTGAPAPAPPPTGTVTFTLFGPNDATCAGAPVFTSGPRPLGGGPPPTAPSGSFTPTAPGAYRWVAAYSGDANYPGLAGACGDANETSVVTQGGATITTSATSGTIGSAIGDTATVSGSAGPVPTGTVTFTLYGPGNPTCAGAPPFTSGPHPLTGGPPPTATSGPFTPTVVGSYQWVASYSGDANYAPVTSPCNAPGETSVVSAGVATLSGTALSPVSIGNPIRDTATVTGAGASAPAPTGTVTFTLFGPGDPTCAGAPVFTSSPRPLGGGPPPTATSEDFTPTSPGTYNWVAAYSGDQNYAPVTSLCGAPGQESVVTQSAVTIVTSALNPVAVGNPIRDTATVTGTPTPTGTVTFTLFGPGDPTCTGGPIFTSAGRPLGGGPPPSATSEDFTPTSPGTYNWVAVYSGDVNHPAATSPCGAPNEASVVTQSPVTIVTSALNPVPIGDSIRDTATVTGTPTPTGTVTFTLFGPANPTCTGAPIFTSAGRPLGGGPPPVATSTDFTPTSPGTYNWVAVYNGDANHPPTTSPCGAPNEASVVTQVTGDMFTQATPTAALGSPISDIATVTGSPAPAPPPTGVVTFTLYGPDDATCAGAPVFTSAAQPLTGGPPPTATSAPFTPTAPGTYRWVAVYSGDANYPSATSPCNAPGETSVVSTAVATLSGAALSPVPIGSPIRDTATVTGAAAPAPAPTGTVTFTLFGPSDPTCTGGPIFTSSPRPLGGPPPPTATSDDFTPTSPGTYNWVAAYSGDANYAPITGACGAPGQESIVVPGPVTITTTAASGSIGSPISDTATVTGAPAPVPPPTGTVTFTLFGPGDPTCAGAPVFTSAAQPLTGGPPPTATSAPFTPTAPGSYRWVAVYSGDANYPSATSPCNAPGETSVVSAGVATLSGTALSPVSIGNPIRDTATVTGAGASAPAPTGTVTFTLFGPGDPTCAGAPVFTSSPRPLGGPPPPTATSDDFTPTSPGTYNWVAAYSGDANYAPITGACGAPGQESIVTQSAVTIVTSALNPVAIGDSIRDTATVTGTPTPTGTVTFTLFGPGDPTCTGGPIFTSAGRPLGGGPPPSATSEDFTPTAPGTYNWVAVYSGDANHPAATSPCGAPNETSVVTQSAVTIVTSALNPVPIGDSIRDTATVTGTPTPTGTVTFTLFGPSNPTCTGAPIFTSAGRPLGGGPPPTATSADFTPTAPGTYNWVAVYSGDANHPAATSPCGAPNEASVVTQIPVAITTSALGPVTIGNPIRDTATVTGTPTPTGTVTFTLFGPANPTCTGAPIFTSSGRPLGGGPPVATSADFAPPTPGTYNWVAVYSGDANHPPATSPCGATNETSVVTQSPVTIVTSALSPVSIGNPIRDTATVTSATAPAPTPTGTVTFTLFGPADPTCSGGPIFASSGRPLGGGPPVATSADFAPPTPGTYNWVAAYSGDANHPPATSPCGATNETSVVTQSPVTIVTSALSPVSIGNPIRDTATVTSATAPAPTPTGTVTFTLFGPADPTCSGSPIFASSGRPLGGGPPVATSADFAPPTPGTYNWVAAYSGDANHPPATSPCGATNETSVVTQSPVTIVTSALSPVSIGSPIRDTATVTSAAAPAPTPTGTVTFTLFGPANPTCAGAPIFTSATRPLGGGPPVATSADFAPPTPGTYNWVAVYSGDVDHPSATSPCGAPNEASVVTQSPVTIVTSALSPVPIGSPVRDTATVTGTPTPTGTVTFTLFGPANPTCTGAPIFTSSPRPLGGPPPPTAASEDFTPTVPGTYNWVAAYSGDANHPSATSPCGSPNEASVVTQVIGDMFTEATPSAGLGSPISDTATVTGPPAPAPPPTGTVTFTLFGPDDATCAGAPIFTGAAQPLTGGPPPTATSAPFTPTAPGTYRWVAVYSGDANYPSITSRCNAPGETSVVGGFGELRVTTEPSLPSQLLVDGVPRDSYGLNWLTIPAGDYELSFTHVEGWTEPPPQTVTVTAGATTKITGTFVQRGTLHVVTIPEVPGAISVDGIPRNNWGLFTDLPVGSHEVCFGPVAGFSPPGCQSVALTAGNETPVTGIYLPTPLAPGAADVGFLRVESSPPVASQILVDGVARDTWGLTWLELPPGMYTVEFTHVEGWTEPPPSTVEVTAGVTTTVSGVFSQRGILRVQTSPEMPGTVFVDGIRRDNWGMWTDLPVGSHEVCLGPLPGFGPQPCDIVELTAGALTTVIHTYT